MQLEIVIKTILRITNQERAELWTRRAEIKGPAGLTLTGANFTIIDIQCPGDGHPDIVKLKGHDGEWMELHSI